ncbi:MAG: YCF48-related protein [bacterium]
MISEYVLLPCRSGFGVKVLFIFLIFISIYSGRIYSQSSWYWTQPRPTGNLLFSVCFTDHTTGYAAGELGTIIKTSDGGTTWTALTSGTDKDLSEIFFINNTSGFAVGKDGIILATDDGGSIWNSRTSGVNTYLHDIVFSDKATGYAAGLSGIILKTIDGGNKWARCKTGFNASLFCVSFINESTGVTGGYNIILKTTNGGKTFSQLKASIYPSSAVVGISYIDSNTIFAAGNSPHGVFYKSTNAGKEWTNSSLSLPFLFDGSIDLVRSMSFLNKNTGFIVTDFGTILKTSDGGNNWFNDSSFRPSYARLSVMYDISSADSLHLNISGAGGTIIRSTDAGMSWFVSAGNKKTLYKDYFTDGATGFSVGENGTILRTENEGLTWESLCKFTNKDLNALYFGNDKTGYAAGERGAIFKTNDLGNSWTDQTHYMNLDYKDIHFTDNETGIAAGGNPENERAFIFKTTNGGTNWYEVYDSLGLGVCNSIEFIDNAKWLVAADNGNILKTIDAGESWESNNLSDEDLHSIAFTNSLNGLVTGATGVVFKSTDGGIEWQRKLAGTYVTLNSIKYFNTCNVIAAGNEGTIITSNDCGNNWTVVPKITNNNLFSVDIINDGIFAFGEYGTIINSKVSSNILSSDIAISNSNPGAYLHQNFPNPFNPETEINYEISRPGNVRIKIYDVLGKETLTLINIKQAAGSYRLKFNAGNLAAGIYFYSLVIDNKISGTRKMLVLK